MKKTIKRLLFLVFILQFFAFAPHVSAGAFDGVSFNDDPIIKQGNTILQKEGDVYIAPGYDQIKVYYTLEGYNSGSSQGTSPLIKLENDSWGCSSTYYYSGANNSCDPNFIEETVNYVLQICDDYTCANPYDTREFSIRFEKYAEVQDDKIYFTNLSQGGEDLVLDGNYYFTLNKKQNAIFSIIGENLDSNANYSIMCGGNSNYQITYTGAQIMDGVEHVCNVANTPENVTPGYRIGGLYDTIRYQIPEIGRAHV